MRNLPSEVATLVDEAVAGAAAVPGDLLDAVLAYVAGGSTRTLDCSPPASPR